jgi:hypothetical protein
VTLYNLVPANHAETVTVVEASSAAVAALAGPESLAAAATAAVRTISPSHDP